MTKDEDRYETQPTTLEHDSIVSCESARRGKERGGGGGDNRRCRVSISSRGVQVTTSAHLKHHDRLITGPMSETPRCARGNGIDTTRQCVVFPPSHLGGSGEAGAGRSWLDSRVMTPRRVPRGLASTPLDSPRRCW